MPSLRLYGIKTSLDIQETPLFLCERLWSRPTGPWTAKANESDIKRHGISHIASVDRKHLISAVLDCNHRPWGWNGKRVRWEAIRISSPRNSGMRGMGSKNMQRDNARKTTKGWIGMGMQRCANNTEQDHGNTYDLIEILLGHSTAWWCGRPRCWCRVNWSARKRLLRRHIHPIAVCTTGSHASTAWTRTGGPAWRRHNRDREIV